MARLVAVRELILKPGVTPTEFERYLTEEFYPAMRQLPAGIEVTVLKGDRGDRVGGYLALMEYDSVKTRDQHHSPTYGGPASKEWVQFANAHRAVFDKWATLATALGAGEVFTDYVAIGK